MRKLNPEEIEVKIKQVLKSDKWSGVVALLYKTARTDMDLLDEEYGPMNWQCEYESIKDNLYCKIGVLNEKTGNWVWKQDCGIESKEDNEGNQKKGEASDAFKRAGFKWGIGRELYTSPKIMFQADVIEKDGRKYLADKGAKYSVQTIQYDDKGDIASLVIVDKNGGVVFTWKKAGFNAHKGE